MAHPGRITPCQVVVHGDHVDTLLGDGVQIDRKGGDQGLAFTGLHFGDHAAMQDDAAHDLHIEMALAEGSLSSLAHGGEGLRHQIVEGFAITVALAKGLGALGQGLVAQGLEFRLQIINGLNDRHQALYEALVGGSENFFGEGAQHINHPFGGARHSEKPFGATIEVANRAPGGHLDGGPLSTSRSGQVTTAIGLG